MFFGPKCTLFMLIISVWGTIFLGILGGLYYNQSVGLFEDLPKESTVIESEAWPDRVKNFENLYQQNAYNAWAAAGAYGAIAVIYIIRAVMIVRG